MKFCSCQVPGLICATSIGLMLAMTAAGAASDDATLQEITVTATRREESINKVPVSVTAFTPEMMSDEAIHGIDDIARLTPGVMFYRGTYGTSTISIRGVGDNSSSGGVGVGTTAVYVDDVPIQARSAPLAFTTTILIRTHTICSGSRCCVVRKARCLDRARWAAQSATSRRLRI